jgi:hypothetical protein
VLQQVDISGAQVLRTKPCLCCWKDCAEYGKPVSISTLPVTHLIRSTNAKHGYMRWRLDAGNGAVGVPNRFLPLIRAPEEGSASWVSGLMRWPG